MENKVVGFRVFVLNLTEKETCFLDVNEVLYVSMAQYCL